MVGNVWEGEGEEQTKEKKLSKYGFKTFLMPVGKKKSRHWCETGSSKGRWVLSIGYWEKTAFDVNRLW